MSNKGGEFSINFTLTTIVAIVSFVILLFVMINFVFIGRDLSGREACHLSVIKRATLDTNAGNFQNIVPLDCETEKICISVSGRNDACEDFAGNKNIKVVKVSNSNPAETKRVIEETSANAMYDCWSMMGEGKLDLFGKFVETFDVTKPKCVICSRVVVAGDVDLSIRENVNVNDYMRSHQIPGSSLTYLQTFTDRGVSSYSEVDQNWDGNYSQFPADFNDLAFIFMQIKTRDPADSAFKVIGGSFVLGGGALLTAPGAVIAKAAGGWGILVYLVGTSFAAGAEYFTARQSQIIASGYCGEFESSADAKNGCSIVKGVEWNANAINSFCTGGIEGRL